MMKVTKTNLEGCIVIEPDVFGDKRGYFFESYHEKRYQEAGIKEKFVQDNFSRSSKGILRGLHTQVNKPQGKLVSVTKGEAFDVAVDLREASSTFGQHYSVVLSEDNHKQFYIPPGFAHGFLAMSDVVHFTYKCTDFYAPEDELGILWNDADLDIDWPIDTPKLSKKDKEQPSFQEYLNILKGLKK